MRFEEGLPVFRREHYGLGLQVKISGEQMSEKSPKQFSKTKISFLGLIWG